ncbi:MAG TPA: magnesium chelatase subunit D [Pseudomonadales bacterium]|nr:magnesium chelatase subunit D [Pseudomonadales bacterium]
MSAAAAPRLPDDPALEDAWAAAMLFAVDPVGTGMLLRGGPGPVRDALLAALRDWLTEDAERDAGPHREPWARMPLGISDDRLLGGLDLTATLSSGRPVVARGLLADADGRVLLVPMIERLSAERVGRLAAVIDQGEVNLEREGVAQRLPARFGLVGLDEGIDDERCAAALTDRVAFVVRAESTVSQLGAGDGRTLLSGGALADARARLTTVTCADRHLEPLCATAQALGIDSLRAVRAALRVACIAAALAGRDAVEDDDVALAARLVLAPRATRLPVPPQEEQDEQAQAPEGDDPQAADPPPQDEEPETGEDRDADAAEDADEAPSAVPDEQTELLVQATAAAVPHDLLAQLAAGVAVRTRSDRSGRSGAPTRAGGRGRPVGVRAGSPRPGERLALVDTLRAAAPWQPLRAGSPGRARIRVEADDFRVKRYQQRTPTVTLFVVDASGSAAVRRLAETKGAVERLLADCYVRRDEVGVIAFRGLDAEVLLPPTRSLVRARRSLSALPGGGGTPLAAGIQAAHRMVLDVRRRGATPVIVLLTDGRANISLEGRGERPVAKAQALASARVLAASGVRAVLIDTSVRPDPAARELAAAMGALYSPLPFADSGIMASVVERVQQDAS